MSDSSSQLQLSFYSACVCLFATHIVRQLHLILGLAIFLALGQSSSEPKRNHNTKCELNDQLDRALS